MASAFKELVPAAERAGVILGFENLLKAEDNARVMDIVQSKAFKIYYDVGNSTNMVSVDAAKEIRWLGRERICQFHLKDKAYLGEGAVQFRAVLRRPLGRSGSRGSAIWRPVRRPETWQRICGENWNTCAGQCGKASSNSAPECSLPSRSSLGSQGLESK